MGNAIQNGDFSNGTNHWNISGSDPLTLIPNAGPNGENAAIIPAQKYISQTVNNLNQNRTYLISFWVGGSVLNPILIEITIPGFGSKQYYKTPDANGIVHFYTNGSIGGSTVVFDIHNKNPTVIHDPSANSIHVTNITLFT